MELNMAKIRFLTLSVATAPSPHSQRQYRMVLDRLSVFLGDHPPDAERLTRYLASLREAGLSDASVAAHDRVLRLFFRRGHELGWWPTDPMRLVKRPRKPKRVPKAVEMDTLGRMFVQAFQEMIHGQVRGVRDLALLVFLADSGSRAAEAATLTRDHLDLRRGVAVVEGKGRQSRPVLLGDLTVQAMAVWLDVRRQLGLSAPTVFCGLSGRGGLTPSGVSQVLHKLAMRAGVDDMRHRAHAFRHLFATSYVAQNGDLDSLARLLGHAQLSTTQVYLGADPVALRHKHDSGSPVQRLMQSG